MRRVPLIGVGVLTVPVLAVAASGADVRPPGGRPAVVRRVTPHLTVSAALSTTVLEPGAQAFLDVTVTPKAGMHVYAPGAAYRPVTIVVPTDAPLQFGDIRYPAATTYLFAPLGERMAVFSAPFTLRRSVSLKPVPGGSPRAHPATMRLTAALEYQACDDTTCYLPVSIPLTWRVAIRR